MATTHIISTSNMSSSNNVSSGTPTAGSSSNIVGVHYKVGKKIGEGSFGVIFEGECIHDVVQTADLPYLALMCVDWNLFCQNQVQTS